jgi:serine/threonine-protein kinase
LVLAPGTRLGRYEIRSRIGAGGMGEVYLAHDTSLDRPIALKVLPADVAAAADRMNRFVQEARTASALNHPNIITVYEIDEAAPVPFIAIEFVDGETLRDRLRRAPVTIAEAIEIAVQIAGALGAAHAAGIVHRDIKPENVMLRRDGLVKVLDFGLAKLLPSVAGDGSGAQTSAPTDAVYATEPGLAVGTALYMSPEQARGLPVDARTDLFSLGVVLYEMIARRLPFDGSNAFERIAAMLADREPPPLSQSAADVPPELQQIVSKALRTNRDERYQTAQDVSIALNNLRRALEGDAGRAVGATAPRSVVRPASRRLQIAAATLVIVIAAGAAVWWRGTRGGGGSTAAGIDAIAVLPFENRTGDPNAEYLADGVTESLINSLSHVPHVRVIARSSVFTYKNKAASPRQVAQDLHVGAVLTGRVLMQGDTVDVRAELTDGRSDAHLWGDHYARKLVDVFAVQDDIARQVTDALRVRLAADDQEQIVKRYTDNAEAYRLYLQGRYSLNQGSETDLNRAIALFDRAVALDPRYALAYAARGETYFNMGDIVLPMKDALARVRQNVDKALSLDDRLVEARMMLANIKFQYEWDFSGSEPAFTRVIALNPNYAEAHHQYAYLLMMTGRPLEAVREMRLAAELDPVNPSIAVDVVLPYLLAREYDRAIPLARKAVDMFPGFFLTHLALGSSLFENGDAAAGIAELEKAKSLDPNAVVLGELGYAYGKAGRTSEARTVLATLEEQAASRYVAEYWLAVIHAGLNEKDEAFALLEKAFAARSWWLVWLKMDQKVDALRSDSRFTDLMRRIGFPQ